jgi:hypothetical protein
MPAADLMSVAPMSEVAPEKTAPEQQPFDYKAALEDLIGFNKQRIQYNLKIQEAMLPEYQRSEAERQKREAEAQQIQTQQVAPAKQRLEGVLAVPLPAPKEPLPEPPLRDTKARPFMSTSGQNAIQGVIASLGLMAQMAMAGKAPVAALGALTGAMRGWTAGDHERAENEWNEYLAQVQRIREENRQQRDLWLDRMYFAQGVETRFNAMYVLALHEAGQSDAAAAAAGKRSQDILKDIHLAGTEADKAAQNTREAISSMMQDETRKLTQQSLDEARRENIEIRWADLHRREADAADRSADRKLAETDRQAARLESIELRKMMVRLAEQAPQGSVYWDTQEGRPMAPSRGQLVDEPGRFRTKLFPQQVQLIDRLRVAGPLFNGIDRLIDNISAVAPGENITQGLLQRLQYKAGIGEDIRALKTLAFEGGIELTSALSSGGSPRLGILYMLRDEAQPNEFMTAGVAHTVNNLSRLTVKNRLTSITDDPKAFDTLQRGMEAYPIPDRAKVPEGWGKPN